jgi:putative transcriptional regulator
MSPYGGKQQVDNQVREYREKAGLTQEELAGMVNLSRQSVIAIEKGRFTPSVLTALSISEALNVSVEKLFQLRKESQNEDQ